MLKEPLISMSSQIREKEAQKKRINLNRKMRQRQANNQQNHYYQSVSATTDTKMTDALAKVRESDDVSIPHSLARFHGTTIYHKPDKG